MAVLPNGITPQVRATLQNMETGGLIQFPLNPSELKSTLAVDYASKGIIGGSSKRLHYQGTGNITFNLTLVINRMVLTDRSRTAGEALDDASYILIQGLHETFRQFLLGLCYPAGRPNDPIRRAPPLALLLWPSVVAMEVVMRNLEFLDNQFDVQLRSVQFIATCTFEEHRRWPLTSSLAQQYGLMRYQKS